MKFPVNTCSPQSTTTLGPSWIVAILPFMEQNAAYDSMVFQGSDFSEMMGANRNWQVFAQLRVPGLNCPASPCDPTIKQKAHSATRALGAPAEYDIQVPDYVASIGYYFVPGTGATPGARPGGGDNAWSGFGWLQDAGLIGLKNEQFNGSGFGTIFDGTSNTISIGEHSDFIYRLDGVVQDSRPGSFNGGAWSAGHGWIRPKSTGGNGGGGWTSNVTVARYPINSFIGNYTMGGLWEPDHTWYMHPGRTLHNGFRSPHQGGVQFVFGDGAVHFISDAIDFDNTFMGLSGRDEGWVVGSFF